MSIQIRQGLLLTYPQCSMTKEELMHNIHEKLDPTWSIVCSERHENEDPHLHAVCRFSIPTQNPALASRFFNGSTWQLSGMSVSQTERDICDEEWRLLLSRLRARGVLCYHTTQEPWRRGIDSHTTRNITIEDPTGIPRLLLAPSEEHLLSPHRS